MTEAEIEIKLDQLTIKDDEQKKEPKSLVTMPSLVKERICYFLDWDSMLLFRRTCRGFRSFIDECLPEFNLTMVQVMLAEYGMVLRVNSSMAWKDIVINELEEGCEVRQGGWRSTHEDIDYFDMFWEAFEFLIKQKSIIEMLQIECIYREADKTGSQFLFKMNKLLETRRTLLNVKNVRLCRNEKLVKPILQHCNPRVLKKIELSLINIDMIGEEMMNLEQWRAAEELVYDNVWQNIPLKYIVQFPKLDLLLENLTVGKLVELKDALLNFPRTFQTALIRQNFFYKIEAPANLGPPYKREGFESKYYFQYPDTNRVLYVNYNRDCVRFHNVPLSLAPEDAFF